MAHRSHFVSARGEPDADNGGGVRHPGADGAGDADGDPVGRENPVQQIQEHTHQAEELKSATSGTPIPISEELARDLSAAIARWGGGYVLTDGPGVRRPARGSDVDLVRDALSELYLESPEGEERAELPGRQRPRERTG